MLGDFNIDMLQRSSPFFSRYIEILNFFGCDQIIEDITRKAKSSSSLIDHIVTNTREMVQNSGIITTGFSDHFVTYCSRRLPKDIFSGSNIKRVRSFKSYSKELLNIELSAIDWSDLLVSVDVDYCLSEFTRLFNQAVDKVAPFKEIRVRNKSNPWMNSEILASIKKRDSLLSRFKRDPSNESLYREFCKTRNAVQRDIKLAKESYFKRGVERNRLDSGKLWGHLKSLGYSKAGSSSKNIVLEENGTKIFDSISVARIFNKFYTTVASNLVAKLPSPYGIFSTSSQIFKEFYSRKIGLRPGFVISPVSSHFILKQLGGLNPKKAIGLDDISSLFLRDGSESIIAPVMHIINLSITTETVPEAFKKAKVIPLFKKGSKLDVGNYRPVSILNVLSKILERAIHSQLADYLEKRNILFENQSGFRGGYSTDSSLIGLSDYIKGEMAKGNLVGMVLIDLQKAFDTVDHAILLEKLRAVGVSSVAWFQSYLSGREQCVEIGGSRSEFLPVSCGVPQGSILGPQLFLIYINDMNLSINCRLSLYADDSALLFSGKNPDVIAERLSVELSTCKRWLVDNKLSLHVGKTECLLFGSRRRLKSVENFRVFCDGTAVQRVTTVKYLGILLDSNLSGSAHVGGLMKTCAGRLSFLYRNSSLLDFNCRKTLCAALIQPYLDYCTSSWYSGLTKKLKERIDVIQRKMARFVYGLDYRSHIGGGEFTRLQWLTVPDRVLFFKMVHLFKIRHNLAPSYLLPNFVSISQTHSHSTRGSTHNYHVSKSLAMSTTSFAYTAVTDWNTLPDRIKEIDSFKFFKRKLKEFLLSRYA